MAWVRLFLRAAVRVLTIFFWVITRGLDALWEQYPHTLLRYIMFEWTRQLYINSKALWVTKLRSSLINWAYLASFLATLGIWRSQVSFASIMTPRNFALYTLINSTLLEYSSWENKKTVFCLLWNNKYWLLDAFKVSLFALNQTSHCPRASFAWMNSRPMFFKAK